MIICNYWKWSITNDVSFIVSWNTEVVMRYSGIWGFPYDQPAVNGGRDDRTQLQRQDLFQSQSHGVHLHDPNAIGSFLVHLELNYANWRGLRCSGICIALIGSMLQTFRHNLSGPSSRVKQSQKIWTAWLLKMGPIRCAKTSASINLRCVTSQKSRGHSLNPRLRDVLCFLNKKRAKIVKYAPNICV